MKKKAVHVGIIAVLILALMREENHRNYIERRSVGAIGLMQLMPATALDIARNHQMELFTENLYDPRINIKLGNYYYAQLRNQFKDKDEYAILAYNGGSGSVFKWLTSLQFTDTDEFIERIPYSETRNYIKKVFKAYWNYKRIYR